MEKDNLEFHSLLGKFVNDSASDKEFETLGLLLEQGNDGSASLDAFAKLNSACNQLISYQTFEHNKAWGIVEGQLQVKSGKLNFRKISLAAAMFLVLVIALVVSGPFSQKSTQSYATSANSQYVLLDDMTEVKLGSQSHLQQHGPRIVALDGNAFFHVHKQDDTNFEIHTKFATLKVLGTSFNINQSDTSMTIQMREGRLEFQSLEESKEIFVIKGTESAIINSEGIEITEGSSKNLLGNFIFKNASIVSVIKDMNGRFNNLIDTNFEDVDETCLLTANFNNLSLLEILEELDLLFELDFKVQNGRVQINALSCY